MTVSAPEWNKVKQIFQAARELAPAERAAYVAGSCDGDAALRAGVDALLAADHEAGGFLASPTLDGDTPTERLGGDLFFRLQQGVAGRFSLERELGRGGMGIVYLAREVALDRHVAIKVLPPALAAVHEHRERFLREARTAAALSHPNIVAIHAVEEHQDLVFFVMAHVDGESLGQRVQRAGPLTPADAARLVQEVAWALGYAHGRGVIHRDIKPDNILIEKGSGRALVTDFGIARVVAAPTMSVQGEVMGTLRYMSPEQASAQAIDGRSDLYSLGVTAFHALTGRLPFESANPSALLAMHLGHPAPPVRSVNASVPARMAEAVDRCLAKDPAARFASGEALADAITDSRAIRADVAPSIRELLATLRSAIWQTLGIGSIWFGIVEVIPRISARPGLLGHPLDPAIAIAGVVTLGILLAPLRSARGVLRAGLNESDVAVAVTSGAMARDANVDYYLARATRVARRLSHPLPRILAGGMAVLLTYWIGTHGFLPSIEHGAFGRAAAMAGNIIINGGFLLALALAPEKVVGLLTRGSAQQTAAIRRFWLGTPGRFFFRLAGVGLRRPTHTASDGSAPTEVMLGRAAGSLFEQLPPDQRRRLGDVHAVIAGLERAAAALRTRRDELAAAAADIGGDAASHHSAATQRARVLGDLEEARSSVEERLQRAVGALEHLRLDLLRLRAGVGTADDLTVSLEEARAVGRAVALEVSALREVQALSARGSVGG